MHKVTWNKKEETSVCLFCKENRVPIKKWNKPCEDCKSKQKKTKTSVDLGIGKRQPAAVWENEDGDKIVVDKFGVPVEDHGYDLDNDPRGHKTTGTSKGKKEIII